MTSFSPIGLGTWQNEDPEQCAESVRTALEMGYRHIDTAQDYENERAVAAGIDAAQVSRDEIFVATKLHPAGTTLDREGIHSATSDSLDRLETDYIDMLYVHWPMDTYDPETTLPAFNELYDEGTIRHIGVSNFEPFNIETALDVLQAPIFANQVEMHPLLQQEKLQAHAEEYDYNLVAYSPLARGDVFDVPEVLEIAEKHDVSAAQVSLAWLREKGAYPIPKATGEAHIRDNFESVDLELEEEDIARIDAIERVTRTADPENAPWNQ